MNLRKITFLLSPAILALILLPFDGSAQHPTREEAVRIMEQQQKLNSFFKILTTSYLDTMNYESVVEKGIASMLEELDPHSVYMTAEELKAAKEDLGGGFSGIGVEFNVQGDTIVVVNTIPGGPSESVGLLPNDRIVEIDGMNAVGLSRSDVPKYLRGAKGTKVELKVFRRGTPALLGFTIVRGDIPINTVDAAYMVDENTGYIKVSRFGSTTFMEFARALLSFDGADNLILDLRGNGGGYLPEAIRMSEAFLDKGQRIVSTAGNMQSPRSIDASRNGMFNRGRLIIMIDESSASASEIVSGAVQDWDRGLIVGRQSFGKGLVQQQFDLTDGSAVRVTIARYLTPTGRAIQRPYEMGHKEEYYKEHFERYLTHKETESNNDEKPGFKTLISGRNVYGSGGITPDIHLNADTTYYSAYWSRLVREGAILEFVQNYLDENRTPMLQRYGTLEDYIKSFDSSTLIAPLVTFAAGKGIEPDKDGLQLSQAMIEQQLRALIAQRLWSHEAYYRISHLGLDKDFVRTLRILNEWEKLPQKQPITDDLVRELTAGMQ